MCQITILQCKLMIETFIKIPIFNIVKTVSCLKAFCLSLLGCRFLSVQHSVDVHLTFADVNTCINSENQFVFKPANEVP